MTDTGRKYRTDDAVVVAVDAAADLLLSLADQSRWTDADRERLALVAAEMVATAHRSRPGAAVDVDGALLATA